MTIKYECGKLVVSADDAVEASDLGIVYQQMTADRQDVELSQRGRNCVKIIVIARYAPQCPEVEAYEAAMPTRHDLDNAHV